MRKDTKPITAVSVVRVSPDQVSAELGEEAAILHMGSGVYFGLDRIGARIWSLMKEPARVADIRESLLSEFAVAPDRLDRELFSLLDELRSHRLIEVSNS